MTLTLIGDGEDIAAQNFGLISIIITIINQIHQLVWNIWKI